MGVIYTHLSDAENEVREFARESGEFYLYKFNPEWYREYFDEYMRWTELEQWSDLKRVHKILKRKNLKPQTRAKYEAQKALLIEKMDEIPNAMLEWMKAAYMAKHA